MHRITVLCIALALDFAFGEPRWFFFHPVRIMGKAIGFLEGFLFLRGPFLPKPFPGLLKSPRIAGVLLCVTVAGGVYLLTMALANAVYPRHAVPGTLIIAFLLYTAIALKGLAGEAGKVIDLACSGDLDAARRQLKSLVGRDTEDLDEGGILKAAVESLAENASDGVLAPIFYYLLGGIPMAMTYKAINTMDSMVGYKNEKYRLFGWAPARLDDLANIVPARLTGLFICLAGAAAGHGIVRPLKTMFRDGRKHPSPNSGVPMAAMAGALGVTLGGPAAYGGALVEKPFIGEGPPPSRQEARLAIKLTFYASLLGAAVMALPGAVIFH